MKIRDGNSVRENFHMNALIHCHSEYQAYINQIISEINTVETLTELRNMYHKIYQDYKADPLGGIYDWSPSFSTAIISKKDDCDGSAVVWANLMDKFCAVEGYEEISRTVVSLVHGNIFHIKQAHVMTVLTTKQGMFLFDYDSIIPVKNWDTIKEYYNKSYLKGVVKKLDEIRIVPIPEYPSY
jgi:hypothetical protein